LPLRDGEPVREELPLELPVVPPSWMLVHEPDVWMLLRFVAFDGVEEEVPDTVTATLLTHDAPLLPHDFTWIVWPPVPVDTEVFSTVPPTVVVDELSSTEYPIDATACPEQLEDDAERLNGEVTVLPPLGALTPGLPEDEADELTLMATSVTHIAPPEPHAFTWIVCPPLAAETDF
jgi:hypothetical protein